MRHKANRPDRIHLISHANPAGKDIARFGFRGVGDYLDFVREHLPPPLLLTATASLFEAEEDQRHGGRQDDAARVRDLNDALRDERTLAIVSANGGAYFSRILPELDFNALKRRKASLWALGFSEMTSLVNIVASFTCGRGVYGLCPNYLAWKIKPATAARKAFANFWAALPATVNPSARGPVWSINAKRAQGRGLSDVPASRVSENGVRDIRVRLIGGCLSVLVGMLAGPLGRRLRPTGRWLAIEDVNEAPYRIDRYLAALKLAGWFDRIAGVLVGDFHSTDEPDQRPAVLELLRFHLRAARHIPIVQTRFLGHVWPMQPVLINQPMTLRVYDSTKRAHRDGTTSVGQRAIVAPARV